MARWTVSFAAAASVNVEAQTPDQAKSAAIKTLKAINFNGLDISKIMDCSVNIYVAKDEQENT